MIRVLLVDDENDLREIFRLVLELHGAFEVVAEAADGQRAIELAEQEQPDLVLLDLRMPVMDGLEALPRILESAPLAKVVVVSGFGEDAMVASARAAGATAYLSKGVPVARLVERLVELMGG